MTHEDIYTKFMIEYDKANITSSYPSLTEFEIATILDKAYLALIAQKLTGNNQRKVPFEYDTKAIEDLRPLIVHKELDKVSDVLLSENEKVYQLNNDMLYYLHSNILTNESKMKYYTKLINHEYADKFRYSDTNHPWIKTPVCYLEGNTVHVLYDSSKKITDDDKFYNTYIKHPKMFVVDESITYKYSVDDTLLTKTNLSSNKLKVTLVTTGTIIKTSFNGTQTYKEDITHTVELSENTLSTPYTTVGSFEWNGITIEYALTQIAKLN